MVSRAMLSREARCDEGTMESMDVSFASVAMGDSG
jgi:hypothetical protein